MSIRDEPHVRIAARELADWLERQGVDRWWSVDGDPLLSGRLSLPAPADELAPQLRRINRTLLVEDRTKNPTSQGQLITAQDLDAFAIKMEECIPTNGARPKPLWANDRVFFLCWEDRDDEWMLFEAGKWPGCSFWHRHARPLAVRVSDLAGLRRGQ